MAVSERHETYYSDVMVEVVLHTDGTVDVNVHGTDVSFGWNEWLEVVEFVSLSKRMTA